MTRLIGLDLSVSPATGAIIETSSVISTGLASPGSSSPNVHGIAPSFTSSARCISTFVLSPDNLDDKFRESIATADGSTAIIAPAEVLGLSVTLPFSDKKRVAALLPQELEDLLPFPASDFAIGLIGSNPIGSAPNQNSAGAGSISGRSKNPGTEHEFELQLVTKDTVKKALAALSALGIDPNVLTTRSSLLVPIAEAIISQKLTQHPELFGERSGEGNGQHGANVDSFFITVPRSESELDILFVISNRIVHHQTLRPAILKSENTSENISKDAADATQTSGEPSRTSLASAIRLELGSIFRRFSIEITTGFIVLLPGLSPEDVSFGTTNPKIGDIPTLLGKQGQGIQGHDDPGISLAIIQLEDLLPNLKITAENASAALGALCCLSDGSATNNPARSRILGADPINFRRGEFSYRPPLTELIRASKRLIRPILLTAGCAAVCGLGLFIIQAQEISNLEYQIGHAVRSVAPQIVADPGKELSALSEESARMELDLKDIGTSDNSSPLELYAELTRHFPQLPDTTVDRVSIRGNRVELRGCAPSYRVIEQIENALNKVKMFGKVKKGSSQSCSGAGSGARGFTFEVESRD